MAQRAVTHGPGCGHGSGCRLPETPPRGSEFGLGSVVGDDPQDLVAALAELHGLRLCSLPSSNSLVDLSMPGRPSKPYACRKHKAVPAGPPYAFGAGASIAGSPRGVDVEDRWIGLSIFAKALLHVDRGVSSAAAEERVAPLECGRASFAWSRSRAPVCSARHAAGVKPLGGKLWSCDD